MSNIRSCSSSPPFSGVVGVYLQNKCGDQIPACAVSASLDPTTESQTYTCNGDEFTLAKITKWDATIEVNFSLDAVASLFDTPLVPVVSQSNINGVSTNLPVGNLPRGINAVILTRDGNGRELHIRALDSEMSNFSFTEFANGSTVTMSFTLSSRNVELVRWDASVQADTSQFLIANRPSYTWFVCDCESGDQVNGPMYDLTTGTVPMSFGNSPETVDATYCCGIDLGPNSCFKTTIPSADLTNEWGVILQGVYDQSVTLFNDGSTSIVWDDTINEIILVNPAGTVSAPFSGGALTLAYSNDGTLIINGNPVPMVPPSPAPMAGTFATNCDTDFGTMVLVSYFTRWLNVSDVI